MTDFFTHERMHIRPDRADWARYQAGKSGQGFRMPGGLKRQWRRTEPKPASVDPVAELRAEMRAGFERMRVEMGKVVFAVGVGVAVAVLGFSALALLELFR